MYHPSPAMKKKNVFFFFFFKLQVEKNPARVHCSYVWQLMYIYINHQNVLVIYLDGHKLYSGIKRRMLT